MDNDEGENTLRGYCRLMGGRVRPIGIVGDAKTKTNVKIWVLRGNRCQTGGEGSSNKPSMAGEKKPNQVLEKSRGKRVVFQTRPEKGRADEVLKET